MRRHVMAGIAATCLVMLGVGACSSFNEERGRGDAPVGQRDDSAAEIVNFPDRFASVTTKCNHGNRIYSTTREAAVFVIPNDPTCGGTR